jgi:hypothetical protein
MEHIEGRNTYGGFHNQNGYCKWFAIDVDQDLESTIENFKAKIKELKLTEFHALVERHGKERGHIYFVFSYPVKSVLAESFLQFITSDRQNMKEIDLRGNSKQGIRLPGGFHRIKKIWPEFRKPFFGWGDANFGFEQALNVLRPMDARKFKRLAMDMGWQQKTYGTLRMEKKYDFASLSIVEVAKAIGMKHGFESKWFCIFHDDRKTPNLHLYQQTNTFHCFADRCMKSGNSTNLIMKRLGLNVEDALNWAQKQFPAWKGIANS